MKVLTVLPNLGIGGGQRVAIDVSAYQKDCVFLIIGKRVENHFTSEVEKKHKVYYLDKEQGLSISIFYRIYILIRNIKPDILHCHLCVSLYSVLPAKLARVKNIVYTFHTIADKDSEGLIRLLSKFAIKYLGMIPIAITETVNESIERIYGKVNTKLIYNGISLEPVEPQYDFLSNEVTLICVASLWEAKNHILLFDSFRELVKKTEIRIKLIIVGDGPLKSLYINYVRDIDIEKYILFTGNINNVSDYLKDSNIFVLTSKFEGLSLAIIEAMSCGLPIVATNVGGNKDIVKNEINGFLVELDDLEGLTNALFKLIMSKDLRASFGKESRNFSLRYSKNSMQLNYDKLYKELINA